MTREEAKVIQELIIVARENWRAEIISILRAHQGVAQAICAYYRAIDILGRERAEALRDALYKREAERIDAIYASEPMVPRKAKLLHDHEQFMDAQRGYLTRCAEIELAYYDALAREDEEQQNAIAAFKKSCATFWPATDHFAAVLEFVTEATGDSELKHVVDDYRTGDRQQDCRRRSNNRPRSGGMMRLRGGVKAGHF